MKDEKRSPFGSPFILHEPVWLMLHSLYTRDRQRGRDRESVGQRTACGDAHVIQVVVIHLVEHPEQDIGAAERRESEGELGVPEGARVVDVH